MKKVDIVIIDPQEDFCNRKKGSLFVEGADNDMKRVAAMIKRIGSKINQIHVTVDSHHYFDVAHPIYWIDSNGNHPDINEFYQGRPTIITKEDVENGIWRTSLPQLQKRGLKYVTDLEVNDRYPLCIWPYHCLIGSDGCKVVPELFEQLIEWEKGRKMVNYVTKGSNPHVEHYSAVKAEVIDPSDPTTQINTPLIKILEETDLIPMMGEAGSHCQAETALDIANAFGDDSYIKKIVWIEDGTSPVTGFENRQDDVVNELIGRGMQISNTIDFLK